MKGLLGVRKGAWNKEEDDLLRQFIEKHGEGKWHQIPLKAGLNRCRKSCRLRWLNYLKPTIKRGDFTEDEIDLMLRLHKLLGNRWSLIAGRLPGRTASDVKNYWSARLRKKMDFGIEKPKDKSREIPKAINIIRPQPRTFKKSLHHSSSILEHIQFENNFSRPFSSGPTRENEIDDWWKTLYDDTYSSSVNRVTCSSSLGLEEDLFKDFWVEDMKKAFDDQEAIGLI